MASNERPATDEPTGAYASTAGTGSTDAGTANGAGYRAERVSTSGGSGTGTRTQFAGRSGRIRRHADRQPAQRTRTAWCVTRSAWPRPRRARRSARLSPARSAWPSGARCSCLGAIYLIQAAIYALALIMPGWLAALIVGGLIAIIGLVMLKSGQKKLQADKLTPHRTRKRTSRRDAQTW